MIIYSLTVDKPNDVNTFPPSVLNSDYLLDLIRSTNNYGSVTQDGGQLCVFSSQTELNTWLNANRLTDSTLISDLDTWKAANGISFNTRVFEVASTDVTVTPVF